MKGNQLPFSLKVLFISIFATASNTALADDISCKDATKFYRGIEVSHMSVLELPEDKEFWQSKRAECKEAGKLLDMWESIEVGYSLDRRIEKLKENKQRILTEDQSSVTNFKNRTEKKIRELSTSQSYDEYVLRDIDQLRSKIKDSSSDSYIKPESPKWMKKLQSYQKTLHAKLDEAEKVVRTRYEQEKIDYMKTRRQEFQESQKLLENAISVTQLRQAREVIKDYQIDLTFGDPIHYRLSEAQLEELESISKGYAKLKTDEFDDRYKELSSPTKKVENPDNPLQIAQKHLQSGSAKPLPINQENLMAYLAEVKSNMSSFPVSYLKSASAGSEKLQNILEKSLVKPIENSGFNFDDTVKFVALTFLNENYTLQQQPALSGFIAIFAQRADNLYDYNLISDNTYQLLQMASNS